jgi:hypothetical protein
MTFIPSRQREWTFRLIVAELPFIPATSSWLKLLLSLLVQETSQEIPLSHTFPESPQSQSSVGAPSSHFSTGIQPLRLNIRKGQTDLHLLAMRRIGYYAVFCVCRSRLIEGYQ